MNKKKVMQLMVMGKGKNAMMNSGKEGTLSNESIANSFAKFFEEKTKTIKTNKKHDEKASSHGKKRSRSTLQNEEEEEEEEEKGKTILRVSDIDDKKIQKKGKIVSNDPSMEFWKNPLSAPIVGVAHGFFRKNPIALGSRKFHVELQNKEGYRTCAKLSVRGTPPVIGLFEPGSHHVIPMSESAAHHESINKAIPLVQEACKIAKVIGYDGVNPGGLCYIAFNTQTSTKQIQLILVYNGEKPSKGYKSFVDALVQVADDGFWHSIHIHCNPASRYDNSIFSQTGGLWLCCYGEKNGILFERMFHSKASVPLYFHPMCFRQANLPVFTSIVKEIGKYIEPNSRVTELYGGVGTIGLNLIEKMSTYRCSDSNPYNKECFEKSVSELSSKQQIKISPYAIGTASERVKAKDLVDADVVIVDPPRKGMDLDVLQGIIQEMEIKRLIYVSCGFKAFVRDFELLKSDFQISFAKGYLMFPGSDHIETLCVFDRKNQEDY